MANNSKKASRTTSKNSSPKGASTTKLEAATASQEALAHTLLPAYQPIDFSAPPQHLEVVHRKIRGLKKKLRRIYDIEQALQDGSKKITKEQLDSLSNKQALERNLADFEEIKSSVEQVDMSASLRLLLGVFFAAASTSSDSLTGLSTLLLPPSCPPPGYNPQQELQHACSVAQQFLCNSQEAIFESPRTTFAQLQDEVKQFLIPKEAPVLPTPLVGECSPAPTQELASENPPVACESPKEEDLPAKADDTAVQESKSAPKENKDLKKPNNRRGNRKSRGDKSQKERGSPKRGRGKGERLYASDKQGKGVEGKEREEKKWRGNNRGRGSRGRGYNNRNRSRDTPKEAPPTAAS